MALSKTKIKEGSTVTQQMTPSRTPFAMTMPKSRPMVKDMKHREINPATVVMELPTTLVSVFCHGNEARGITLEGLQYPLHDAALTCDIPLGVSNHYAADHPRISVREGTLLVIVYQDQQ